MKYKVWLTLIIIGTLLTIALIFSIVGSYQLYVELDDERGMFFISWSVVPVFIVIGMAIGLTIKGE